jgi:hypothetical protein
MTGFFAQRLNPDWYHGKGKRGPFFEGWYYKLVTKSQERAFAIIPGVFIAKNPGETHAFIQVLDGTSGRATYHAIRHFAARDAAFDVQIGGSTFSREKLSLSYEGSDGILIGEVRFTNMAPFPVTLRSPGIMGWYGWLPFMECNHGIVSMDHELHGSLNIYGEQIDFTGGRGYIEKDWGTNFPSGYIWMQSNHFSAVGTSFTASIAVIPNLGRRFAGFIVALLHQDRLYRFATYNNTRVDHLSVDSTTVRWRLHNNDHELVIEAERASGAALRGPAKEAMHMRVDETMQARIRISLYTLDRFRRRLVLADTGTSAGLEVVGNLEMLLKP